MNDARAASLPEDAPGDLCGAPVEIALRELLSAPLDDAALAVLQRYQRKLDIGRKLLQRYVGDLGAAQSEQEISPQAYASLAQAFAMLAGCETSDHEMSRARMLRYVNSAFNCVDKLDVSLPLVGSLLARLEGLAREASR